MNANKSESIFFENQRKNRNIDPPKFDATPIEWKKQVKYLGETLDHKLKFHTHITNVRNKANGAVSKLYPLLGTFYNHPVNSRGRPLETRKSMVPSETK